jgi:cell division protein ZapA (FtsZ GTPase activity inhibitor)
MSTNRLEDKQLKQINEANKLINEGILSSIVGLFLRSKMKKQYKKVYKIAKDDPKLQSALADMENYQERIKKLLKDLCRRNPDHPKCD